MPPATVLPMEIKILDPRLHGWGLPRYQSDMAAAIDLHACLDSAIEIAPGELIVPAQAAREMSRDALGPGSRGGMPGAQAASSGGGGMRVDRIEVHLHAPSGVTGAQELTVFALSSALERLQLVSGR